MTLLVVLPVLGCFRPEYGLQTLAAVLVVAAAFSVGVIGRSLVVPGKSFRTVVFLAILGQGLYGAGQTLNQIGVLPDALWSWAIAWDSQSQSAYATDYLISQRSTGLFINPNDFAMWSLLALIFAFSYFRGRRRWIAVLLAVVGILGSGSRTALVALALVALMSWAAHRFAVPKRVSSVGVPLIVVAGVITTGVLPKLAQSQSVSRLSGIGAILGVGTDPNLSGRISAWKAAQSAAESYPLGTFGPPQVVVGQSIDNQFIAFFLQGGVLLVVAYLLLLVAPWTMQRMGCATTHGLKAMAVVIAVFSITATAFGDLQTDALVLMAAVITLREAALETPPAVPAERPSSLESNHSGELTHAGR